MNSSGMQQQYTLRELRFRTRCRLQPSPRHGVGVFAIREIPAGTNPFYTGPAVPQGVRELPHVLMDQTQVEELPRGVQELVYEVGFQIDGEWVIPPMGFTVINLEWFLNHSVHPNMRYWKLTGCFYTLREIGVGDELTVDYRTYGDPINGIEGWK